MNSKPLVSVLVPTFNDGEMLIAALESLRRQTFDDFEAIVCDDASTNGTAERAKDWCKTDRRFRLFRNPVNLGMTQNWNHALSHAQGEYIAKLDGDDSLQPQTLERLVDALRQHQAEIGFCRTIECDDALRPLSSYYGERAFVKAGIEPLAEHLQSGHYWYRLSFDDFQLWHSNAFLVSRRVMALISGWDAGWGCASDTDLILRLLELDLPVAHVPYPGVLYRKRTGSVSDLYRKRRWLALEGTAVHLLSLARFHQSNRVLSQRLRHNWYRLWKNWGSAMRSIEQQPTDKERLRAVDVRVDPPPSYILVEGGVRRALWTARNAAFGRIGR
ncbi:MAG: glycosyltransferase family 2 protein [Chromatiaceae bacterium]|jgi:glycosyltransferase involved in cell wall biosynthesis|nr:glycosyltransferase family 2 protein [Chromatiaceae bacterium]